MSIKNQRDLDGIRRAGRAVAAILAGMRAAVRPGITTAELDEVGAREMTRLGARSAPRRVYGFPGVTLISVNDEIVHGVPGDRRLRAGDIVKLDVTAELDGYIADAAETVVVPPTSDAAARLGACAREAFARGLEAAQVGRPVREIGAAVEGHVRACGFHVVRELCGHGVGRTIHEEPSVPNYDDPFAVSRTDGRPGHHDRAAHHHRTYAAGNRRRRLDDAHPQRVACRASRAHDHRLARWCGDRHGRCRVTSVWRRLGSIAPAR